MISENVSGRELAARFDALLRDKDHSLTSTTKYRDFEDFLGDSLDISPNAIYTAHIARASNFDVRMTQSRRAREASFRVALVPNRGDLEPVKAQSRRLAAERSPGSSMLVVSRDQSGWRPDWGMQPDAGTGGVPAMDMSPLLRIPGSRLESYAYRSPARRNAMAQETSDATETPLNPVTVLPPIIDPRIRSMLRNAIASSKAIMLVGPPGTGKSTLVAEVARECAVNPSAYGMTCSHDLSVVTPDESWSARDLVGGISVEASGQLKFAPGHVLHAVRADKWLLLDEANRANLDKIFGGLLTWLAGQQVTVGRVTPGSETEIILSWSSGFRSTVDNRDAPTVYRAGKEWRLLGTYNSLDAHQVFRLGLALSRRFLQIPVSPPAPDDFRDIIHERLGGVLEDVIGGNVADIVARIYEIHSASGAAALGPAPFLSILEYVSTGIRTTPLSLDNPTDPRAAEELIAEAYLSSFGTWLARLDNDVLDNLGARLRQDDALGGQWAWVREQLPNLA